MAEPEGYHLAELLRGFPPEPAENLLFPEISRQVKESGRKLVVIDDDPTGVQTVHNITLLTSWEESALEEAFLEKTNLFFILTNSRSKSAGEAVRINLEIAGRLKKVGRKLKIDFVVASRSDSTLRGHYPAEILALEQPLGPFDGHLLIPAFFEGGRFTLNDTHYVATPPNSGILVPASQTPFAEDKVFGFKNSCLPAWIEEKSGGKWKKDRVESLSLELIRRGGPAEIAAKLEKIKDGLPVVVNAAGYGDLAVVVLGLLQAENRGKRFLYRTAAGFVRIRGAVEPKALLEAPEIFIENNQSGAGGLVIVGSYVPGSGIQLENLLALPRVKGVELVVSRVLTGEKEAQLEASAAGKQLQEIIESGQTAVIYTSRQLVTGETAKQNLEIGEKVSEAILTALKEVATRPRFILAKGGITSHEVAQKGLGAEKALALGQLLPGVPVWRLESGPQLKFKGVPFVVFPGNVGGPEGLAQAVLKLQDFRF